MDSSPTSHKPSLRVWISASSRTKADRVAARFLDRFHHPGAPSTFTEVAADHRRDLSWRYEYEGTPIPGLIATFGALLELLDAHDAQVMVDRSRRPTAIVVTASKMSRAVGVELVDLVLPLGNVE